MIETESKEPVLVTPIKELKQGVSETQSCLLVDKPLPPTPTLQASHIVPKVLSFNIAIKILL